MHATYHLMAFIRYERLTTFLEVFSCPYKWSDNQCDLRGIAEVISMLLDIQDVLDSPETDTSGVCLKGDKTDKSPGPPGRSDKQIKEYRSDKPRFLKILQ